MSNLVPGPLSDRTGCRSAALLTKYAAPDVVWSASTADLLDVPKIRSNFADDTYTYPIHTKAAAWVSAGNYHASGSKDTVVGSAIKSACDYFGLSNEWNRLETECRSTKSAEDVYALPDAKKYVINNEQDVKLAYDYFDKYANDMGWQDRQQYAQSLLNRVSNNDWLDTSIKIRLEKEAGYARLSNDPKRPFNERIRLANLHGEKELASALEKASNDFNNNPLEAAAALREVDRVMGWRFPDPINDFVRESPTEARTKLAQVIKSSSGNWYKISDIKQVPDDEVREFLGNPLVLPKNAYDSILQDNTKCAAFEQILKDHGVKPVEHASPTVDWKALASGGS